MFRNLESLTGPQDIKDELLARTEYLTRCRAGAPPAELREIYGLAMRSKASSVCSTAVKATAIAAPEAISIRLIVSLRVGGPSVFVYDKQAPNTETMKLTPTQKKETFKNINRAPIPKKHAAASCHESGTVQLFRAVSPFLRRRLRTKGKIAAIKAITAAANPSTLVVKFMASGFIRMRSYLVVA